MKSDYVRAMERALEEAEARKVAGEDTTNIKSLHHIDTEAYIAWRMAESAVLHEERPVLWLVDQQGSDEGGEG